MSAMQERRKDAAIKSNSQAFVTEIIIVLVVSSIRRRKQEGSYMQAVKAGEIAVPKRTLTLSLDCRRCLGLEEPRLQSLVVGIAKGTGRRGS